MPRNYDLLKEIKEKGLVAYISEQSYADDQIPLLSVINELYKEDSDNFQSSLLDPNRIVLFTSLLQKEMKKFKDKKPTLEFIKTAKSIIEELNIYAQGTSEENVTARKKLTEEISAKHAEEAQSPAIQLQKETAIADIPKPPESILQPQRQVKFSDNQIEQTYIKPEEYDRGTSKKTPTTIAPTEEILYTVENALENIYANLSSRGLIKYDETNNKYSVSDEFTFRLYGKKTDDDQELARLIFLQLNALEQIVLSKSNEDEKSKLRSEINEIRRLCESIYNKATELKKNLRIQHLALHKNPKFLEHKELLDSTVIKFKAAHNHVIEQLNGSSINTQEVQVKLNDVTLNLNEINLLKEQIKRIMTQQGGLDAYISIYDEAVENLQQLHDNLYEFAKTKLHDNPTDGDAFYDPENTKVDKNSARIPPPPPPSAQEKLAKEQKTAVLNHTISAQAVKDNAENPEWLKDLCAEIMAVAWARNYSTQPANMGDLTTQVEFYATANFDRFTALDEETKTILKQAFTTHKDALIQTLTEELKLPEPAAPPPPPPVPTPPLALTPKEINGLFIAAGLAGKIDIAQVIQYKDNAEALRKFCAFYIANLLQDAAGLDTNDKRINWTNGAIEAVELTGAGTTEQQAQSKAVLKAAFNGYITEISANPIDGDAFSELLKQNVDNKADKPIPPPTPQQPTPTPQQPTPTPQQPTPTPQQPTPTPQQPTPTPPKPTPTPQQPTPTPEMPVEATIPLTLHGQGRGHMNNYFGLSINPDIRHKIKEYFENPALDNTYLVNPYKSTEAMVVRNKENNEQIMRIDPPGADTHSLNVKHNGDMVCWQAMLHGMIETRNNEMSFAFDASIAPQQIQELATSFVNTLVANINEIKEHGLFFICQDDPTRTAVFNALKESKNNQVLGLFGLKLNNDKLELAGTAPPESAAAKNAQQFKENVDTQRPPDGVSVKVKHNPGG